MNTIKHQNRWPMAGVLIIVQCMIHHVMHNASHVLSQCSIINVSYMVMHEFDYACSIVHELTLHEFAGKTKGSFDRYESVFFLPTLQCYTAWVTYSSHTRRGIEKYNLIIIELFTINNHLPIKKVTVNSV